MPAPRALQEITVAPYPPLSHISLGNPHGVCFEAELVARREEIAADWAGQVPGGINLSFAERVGPQTLRAWVFERGVGWTEACGSGACAIAYSAARRGLVDGIQPITVELPGGTLQLEEILERPRLIGPAKLTFSGDWSPGGEQTQLLQRHS